MNDPHADSHAGPSVSSSSESSGSPGGLPGLDVPRLAEELVEHGPYSRVERVESIDSTNLFLQRAGQDPGEFARQWPHLSVLTAEEQTGGRGRVGRAWSSPARTTLSTSVVLRPDWDPEYLRWASLLAALSLAEVLDEQFGIPARVKWPNDVHVEDRKISGILALITPGAPDSSGAPRGFAVILGIGVNVLLEGHQLPTETSTSVILEQRGRGGTAGAGRGAEQGQGGDLRTQVLIALLRRLGEHLHSVGELADQHPTVPLPRTALGQRLLAMMDTIGRRVRVELPGGAARRGTATGLEDDGALIVEVCEQRASQDALWTQVPPQRESFSAVDVVHLRPEASRGSTDSSPLTSSGTAG